MDDVMGVDHMNLLVADLSLPTRLTLDRSSLRAVIPIFGSTLLRSQGIP
jgi:hypothetical protein